MADDAFFYVFISNIKTLLSMWYSEKSADPDTVLWFYQPYFYIPIESRQYLIVSDDVKDSCNHLFCRYL